MFDGGRRCRIKSCWPPKVAAKGRDHYFYGLCHCHGFFCFCIVFHLTTYAVLIPSDPARHDSSLAGLHALISDPGYSSQHQKWRNIICLDEAAYTLRQHLDRFNANIIRRRCPHHFSVSHVVLPHHFGKPLVWSECCWLGVRMRRYLCAVRGEDDTQSNANFIV